MREDVAENGRINPEKSGFIFIHQLCTYTHIHKRLGISCGKPVHNFFFKLSAYRL